MSKIKFPKEDLQDLLDFSVGEGFDGYLVCQNKILDTRRWSIYHELVFSYEGKYYRVFYSCGATESQDERPFEYDDDEVSVDEVERYEVTVYRYRKVIPDVS